MNFPDDRLKDFVGNFRTAVAPDDQNRSILETSPPLFILRVPETGSEDGRRRVIEALKSLLDDNGKRVPYVHLTVAGAATLLAETAGNKLSIGAPEHMTPDRYRHFRVARDLVAYVRHNPNAWEEGPQHDNLRLYAAKQHSERSGLMRFTRMEAPDVGGFRGFLAKVGWLSFVQWAPRRVWAGWTSRKTRRWVREQETSGSGGKLFRMMDVEGAGWASQLQNNSEHPEALGQIDRLLFRALRADLRTPAIGGLLPGRRRRTARPVLIVDLPPSDEEGVTAAERFLRSVHQTCPDERQPGPLVIAVGRPSAGLLADLGDPAEVTFVQAGQRFFEHGGPPALASFTEDSMTRPAFKLPTVKPKTFRFSRRVPDTIIACLVVLAVIAAGFAVLRYFISDHDCVGGAGSVAESARAEPIPIDSKGWYDAALREIGEQNARAERDAAKGRTVRTVVAFVSSVPTDENETRFDGTIPELRGIAMWQLKLLDDAVSNDSAVPLRVEVRPTGRAFQNAVPEAKKLAAQVRAESPTKSAKDYTKVVGVLAYAQSRDETQAALQVLGAAKIPTIGTTATADEMLTGNASLTYWPFTPANSTEARIEADFASKKNIVAGHGSGDECSPARHALVIESSTDLYSRSLADKFRAEFPGTAEVFNFNQDSAFEPAPSISAPNLSSAGELARQLCKALKAKPKSVVYWSARARDFTAFIEAMDTQGTCIDDDITVLGGNELTNVAQTGAYSDKNWLRLYYSAHRLPATDSRASIKTRQFVSDYTAFVEDTTKGTDPWVQDGHSAVSYDAFHVLSQAIDQANVRDKSISRESVLSILGAGVTFNGATGYVVYEHGNNAPPVDKTLVLLRQLGDAPKAVTACGAYTQKQSGKNQKSPCTR
ncbi:ABC transporter substrate-binding protein [Actinomadura darangshiensis]|uniref:ABC transporter substrate-binding protein n=1 Tax=Actinomadura darangshiensis TaxID=705336 RepID=A0A4R5B505_9ACTN|nr:ABC transporter substrate-binding protein [Actinomadura darangshiensis]TDD81328.1 ABC transporter substrate-binding protein [Actinomadura darangshiensis]